MWWGRRNTRSRHRERITNIPEATLETEHQRLTHLDFVAGKGPTPALRPVPRDPKGA